PDPAGLERVRHRRGEGGGAVFHLLVRAVSARDVAAAFYYLSAIDVRWDRAGLLVAARIADLSRRGDRTAGAAAHGLGLGRRQLLAAFRLHDRLLPAVRDRRSDHQLDR